MSNDRFDRALDHAFSRRSHSRRIMAGPFKVELIGTDAGLVEALASVFVADDDAGGPPDLSLAVCDAAHDSLTALVPTPADKDHIATTGDYFAQWQPDWAILQLYSRSRRQGLLWSANGHIPQWVLSRPFLPLLHAHALPTPWTPIHAGAVGLDGRFVLIAGPGKSGKTTATLACAEAGWHYAGDDFVMIHTEDRRVAPIYTSARLRADGVPAFGNLVAKSAVADSDEFDDPRVELRLSRQTTGTRVGGGRFVALLLPQRRGAAEPVFSPASATAVYARAVMVTVLQLTGMQQEFARKLTGAIRGTPAFQVDTGTDPRAIPAAFRDFLQGID